MQFSLRASSNWRTLMHTLFGGWFGRELETPVNLQPSAQAKLDLASDSACIDKANPIRLQTGVANTGTRSAPSVTPIEWLAGLPRDMSLVIAIDQPTCQTMEMVAMSRKQAAEYLRSPIYTDHQTRWEALAQHRLRRVDFAPAIAFQQQEDALNELESLFSARWHATTELANLDQSILRAYEAVFPALSNLADEPKSDTQSSNPSPVSALRDLLISRKILSEELARIDEAGIPALQKLGMPLPQAQMAPG